MKTIDERIEALEKLLFWADGVHGTSITRGLTETGQIWTIGFGAMYAPKMFYTATSIEEALSLAEKDLNKNGSLR